MKKRLSSLKKKENYFTKNLRKFLKSAKIRRRVFFLEKKIFYVGFLGFFCCLFSETWDVDSNGLWNTASNWSPPSVPDSSSAVATFGSVITAPRVITLSSSIDVGVLNFDNANAYTIASNTFNINEAINITNVNGNGAHIITSNLSLVNDTTITQSSTQPFTLSGVISNTGSLIKEGTGTLVLSGNNTFSGNMNINNGTLSVSINNNLGGGDIVLDGGTIKQTSGPFNSSNNIVLQSGGGIFDIDTNNVFLSIGLLIGNSEKITKIGNGTLVLNGPFVSLFGEMELNEGVLRLASPILPNNITLNGGTLSTTNIVTNSPVISLLEGGGTFETVGSSTLSLSSGVSGTGGFTKTGTGTLTFLSANTYTGGTTISEGTLVVRSSEALNTTITNNGSLVFSLLDGDFTYDRVIAGSGGLIKESNNTLTLNAVNTYSGSTRCNEGVLSIAADNNLGTGTIIFFDGGTLNTTANISSSKLVHLLGSATFDTNANTTLILSSIISGVEGLTKTGSGTLILESSGNAYDGGTTVSEGILSGTTASLQGNITNNGLVTFDQTTTGTYSGVISGTGSVTKENTGTVTLSGVNTYSGITNFNGGTIVIGADNNLGSGGNLVFSGGTLNTTATFTSARALALFSDGATLNTDGGTTLTLSNNISGLGGVNKTGTGSLSLTGTNTYVGDNTISSGTLIGTIDSVQGNVINNGALTLNQTTDGTFAGDISGTGSFTKTGTGVVTMSGTNTYSGGTTLSAGGLTGTTSSLQGNITNNGAVVFNQNVNGTYAGQMSGTGSLSKQGSGQLILEGVNSVSGATSLEGGILTVNGSLTAGTIGVEAGTTLNGSGSLGPTNVNGGIVGGTGTYTSLTVNAGIVRPGDSIGTINIAGDYTQGAGTTLELELFGDAHDKIVATGTATIDADAILNINPLPASYVTPISYDLLSAAGGINQLWGTVNFPTEFDFSLELVNGSTVARLTLLKEILFFNREIDSGNPQTVVDYLRCLDVVGESDLDTVIEATDSLSDGDLNKALNTLHPALFAAFELVNLDNNVWTITKIMDQLNQLPCNARACFPTKSQTHGDLKHNVWSAPFGNFTKINRYQQLRGYETQTAGALFGYDTCFKQTALLGIASGYTFTRLRWDDTAGNAKIHKVSGAIYFGCEYNRVTIDANLLGGINFYRVRRQIQFSTISRSAKNRHLGKFITAHLGGKYTFYVFGEDLLEPFGKVDYSYLHQPSYKETGASSLNLSVSKKNSRLLRSELGLKYTLVKQSCFNLYFACSFVQKKRISGNSKYRSTFKEFSHLPCKLVIHTFKKNKNFISPETGVIFTRGNVSFSVSYKGEFAHRYTTHQASAKVQGAF